MKLFVALALCLLVFGQSNLSAEEKIPRKLHGYWLFDGGNKGNWDEILVGENFVELLWDLYRVDSLRENSGKYELWLSNKDKGTISLHIEIKADSLANFKFDKLDNPITAKLNSRHPDIVYYDAPEMQKKIAGNWIAADNLSKEFSLRDKQMLLDGKQWEVLWFGEYLKKEYRALLRENGNHRLVYFKKRGPLLNIGGDGKDLNYSKKPKFPAILQVLGNWYEPTANQWTFGFFEDFAIYKGQFWDYEKFSFNGSTGQVVLTDHKKKLTLSLSKSAANTLTIKVGKAPTVKYDLAGNRLPGFNKKDEAAFKNTHFQRVDTAYITGYLRNAPNQEPFGISYHNPLSDNEETVYGELDSLGRFVVKVPLFNTTQVFLDWRRTNKMDVLEPGERYFLYYDAKQFLMMGDNARLHTELSQYEAYKAFPWNQEEYDQLEKLNGLPFLTAQKAKLQKADAFSKAYFDQNPNLSAKFKYFVNNFNRYNMGRDLMQKRFRLDRQNGERFPKEYMAYVTDTVFKDPVAPFTLIRDFSTFIRDYIDYEKEGTPGGGTSVNHSEVLLKLISSNQIQASAAEKEAAILEWKADSLALVDSLGAAAFAKTISADQRSLTSKLKSKHQNEMNSAATDLLWERVLGKELEFYEKTVSDPDILKPQISKLLYQYLERTRKPMDAQEFQKYTTKINSPALEASVVAYQKHLIKLPKMDFAYAASLKNTSHLKESKDADSIFKSLIAPYKGKVIYLDVWGTWCQPCREEMKFANAAKDALKGKDVVFMYLANNSPEESWKNIIKEMNLTSENTVHYRLPDLQQSLIERRLSVKGFPTFMLIDKEGNIVNTAAPRPSEKDKLVSSVSDLLK